MEGLNIPILKSGGVLLVSPQIALHDRAAVLFKEELLSRITETRAKGLVFDVSAIDVVDSFLVRQIGEVARAAKIMGAEVVVTGLRPAVAITLVEMGFDLKGVHTARDLEGGMERLKKAGKA